MIFAPSSPITNSSGIYLSVYQNDRRSSRKEFGVAAAADLGTIPNASCNCDC